MKLNPIRIVILGILAMGLIAGIAMYYLQVYAYYATLPEPAEDGVTVVSNLSGAAEPIPFENFRGIDSDSSPIRYRACFDTALSLGTLTDGYQIYAGAVPLVAPGWFDCFDAGALGEGLASGEVIAFLGQENVLWGVDRVIAVDGNGQAWGWNQINPCGEALFSGGNPPEGCPEPPANAPRPQNPPTQSN